MDYISIMNYEFIIIRVFCPRADLSLLTPAPILPKDRSSTANSETKIAVLLEMSRCGSFPLLSVLLFLFSIWSGLKRSENIPGAPAWRWARRIWLTGTSGRHRRVFIISSISIFDQIRDTEINYELLTEILIRSGLDSNFVNIIIVTSALRIETNGNHYSLSFNYMNKYVVDYLQR